MPTTVTAYDVRIVPSGDAAIASCIARDVLAEWNSLHGRQQKRMLLPLPAASGTSAPADLLVAFYCPAHAGTDRELNAQIETEIERHVAAGRPVLVYCSDARDGFHDVDCGETPELIAFQQRFQAKVLLDSFGDEKIFRSAFSRQLLDTVANHPHFANPVAEKTTAPAPAATTTLLSSRAQSLLLEACSDPEAYIGRVQDASGLKLQANGKQLVEPGAGPEWEKAFQELLTGGYVRDAGCHGRLFQISTTGFAFLKTIGVTPIGYIAELGGM